MESKTLVCGTMFDIISSVKIRYAEKRSPEERHEKKFAHMSSSSNHLRSSSQSDLDVDCAQNVTKRKKRPSNRKRSKGKGNTEDAQNT